MKLLTEAPHLTSYFFGDPDDYEAELLVPKKTDPPVVADALQRVRDIIATHGVADEAALEAHLRELAETLGLKAGQLFMPIRVAVTGRAQSPGLFETLRVIGQDRVLERLDAAIAKAGGVTNLSGRGDGRSLRPTYPSTSSFGYR